MSYIENLMPFLCQNRRSVCASNFMCTFYLGSMMCCMEGSSSLKPNFLQEDFPQEIGHVFCGRSGESPQSLSVGNETQNTQHSHFPMESFGCIFLHFFRSSLCSLYFSASFGLRLCLVFGSQAAAADGSGKVFGLDKWQRGEDGSNG